MEEMYDILNYTYTVTNYIPRSVFYGTLGAIVGMGYAIIKKKNIKECINYATLGALIVGGSDAFLDAVWDREWTDIIGIYHGWRAGYTTNTTTTTLEKIVEGNKITYITQEITKQEPFYLGKEIISEIQRLIKYSLEATINTVIAGISGRAESIIAAMFCKRVKNR